MQFPDLSGNLGVLRNFCLQFSIQFDFKLGNNSALYLGQVQKNIWTVSMS